MGIHSSNLIEGLEHRVLLSTALLAADPEETPLGAFGVVNGKTTPLVVSLGGKRKATLNLTGATGNAFEGNGEIQLEITDLGRGAALTVAVKGGGSVDFSNINITGNLKLLKTPQSTISGALNVSGSGGALTLGDVSGNISVAGGLSSLQAAALGGTLAVGGAAGTLKITSIDGNVNITGNLASLSATNSSSLTTIYVGGFLKTASITNVEGVIASASEIGSLTAMNVKNATVLAGANLGADGQLGGTGLAADTFAAGTIGTLRVNGSIDDSFFGAGVNPIDGIFGNGNDTAAGTGLIKSIFSKHAPGNTQFEAAAFGIAKLPGKVVVTTDPQFIVL